MMINKVEKWVGTVEVLPGYWSVGNDHWEADAVENIGQIQRSELWKHWK